MFRSAWFVLPVVLAIVALSRGSASDDRCSRSTSGEGMVKAAKSLLGRICWFGLVIVFVVAFLMDCAVAG